VIGAWGAAAPNWPASSSITRPPELELCARFPHQGPRQSHRHSPALRQVLVSGGYNVSLPVIDELYDPATGFLHHHPRQLLYRHGAHATLLPGGQVLVAGGNFNGTYLNNAELYDPGLGFNTAWRPVVSIITTVLNGIASGALRPPGKSSWRATASWGCPKLPGAPTTIQLRTIPWCSCGGLIMIWHSGSPPTRCSPSPPPPLPLCLSRPCPPGFT